MAPPDSESGPNLGSFNELGATAAAGGIVGTNHLQDAITKLTQAVTDFDTSVNKLQGVSSKLSGGAGLSGAWNNNGIETFAKQSAGKLGGNFNIAGPSMNVSGITSMAQQAGNMMGGTLGGVCTNTGGGAYKGYGQPSGGSGGMGAFGGGGGGGYGAGQPGLGPVPGQPRAGGDVWARAVNGGGSVPSKAATFAALGATVAAAGAGYAVSAGKAQMAPQLALNSYQQQAQLIAPLGSNYGQNQQTFSQATYGTQGRLGGQASYAGWGNSGQDIAATYSMISGLTGRTPNQINAAGPSTLPGQMMQGVGTLNYLNPGLGGQGAAALQQSMYNPSRSLSMRALGYPATPLTPGRPGVNGTGQVIGGMMSRWGWGANNRISPANMAAELGPNGIAFQNMLAMGYTQQQATQMAPEIEAYGRLYQGNGRGAPALTGNQADQMLSGLHARSPQIRQQTDRRLQAYGIGQTDISQMQANAGSQAATMGDQSAGFTRGLKDATGALEQFRKTLGQINNTTGLSGALGFGKGFGGMMSTGAMSGIGGGIGGLLGALLGPLAKGLIGRGAGGAAGAATRGASSLWRGAGAGEAGGAAGAGIGLGTAAGAAGLGLAGWGAQKGLEGAARSHIRGKGGSTLGDLLGLANPFNFGGWHKDFSGLWHNLFGGGASSPGASSSPGGSTVAGGGSLNNLMTAGVSHQSLAAVKAAESQIGVPYAWGAEKPGKGFDCAGLTQWAYKQAGIQLPRTVEEQWKFLQGRAVDPRALQQGDLVFGVSPGGNPNNPTHVGIMVSGSKVLEAPYTGGQIGIRNFMRTQWQRAARPSKSMTNTKKNVAGAASTNRNSPMASGYVNPFSQVKGLTPQRVDQGVDFDGSGPILAIGNAVIGETGGGGWPGGPFMSYQLTDGQFAGNWVYVAENIHPTVSQGQTVRQGQTIATMFNGGTGIETGWAAAGGTSTESQTAAAGGIGGGNLPASGATAIGMSFENFLVSLGVPKAPNFGAKTGGKVPGSFGSPVGGGTPAGNSNAAGPGSPQWGTASQAGMGESTSEGSTTEVSAFMGAVSGGVSAGSPWKPNAISTAPGGGAPAGGPAGSAVAGSAAQNGRAIYQYLLTNLFGGNKVAAAGAIASMYGESGWNPESKDCVPLTYKVVTTRGILAHDEVKPGDFTPVFDTVTRQVVESEILDVPYHPNARICRFGNANWSVICTWDHKWIVKDGGLMYAAWLYEGTQIMLGEDHYEIVEFFEDMGFEDTFCLTTTTGTWTAYRDEQVAEDEGVEPGEFWTGNTGGRGLIGWTPYGTLANSAYTGNATADLNAQLPLIIKFVQTSGDQAAISAMEKQTSLLAAANIWGKQVERFGVNDVHGAGLAAAAAIAGIPNNARGGPMAAGSYSLVGERGPEVVWNPKAGQILDASQSRKLMQSAMGPHTAGPTSGYNYSSLHRAFNGGGSRMSAGGGGVVVNINTLNFGGGGNASGTPGVTTGQTPSWMPNGIMNTQNPARSFAKYIAGLIEQETMHNQISGGVNA
jgi:cell wall-associated NlpC family hydrolase